MDFLKNALKIDYIEKLKEQNNSPNIVFGQNMVEKTAQS